MLLADIRLGFPILRLDVRIHHSTPRRPTAFERVLLKVCDRLGANPSYNSIALDQIFSQFLGVTDPVPLLDPTLAELVRIAVLRSKTADLQVDRLMLRDIEITDRGRQMLVDDQLPSHPQSNDEVFYYDPIGSRFLSSLEAKVARDVPPTTFIEAESFRELLPEDLIRASVARNKSPWWTSSSRIDKIERISPVSILWRDTPASINLIEGVVRIDTKDIQQADYVGQLPSADVYNQILVPSLLPSSELSKDWISLDPVDLSEVKDAQAELVSISDVLKNYPDESPLWIVNSGTSFIQMPETAFANKVLICFDSQLQVGTIKLDWNPTEDGCLVMVGGISPLLSTLLVSQSKSVSIFRGLFKIGRDQFELPLAMVSNVQENSDKLLAVLNLVAANLKATDSKDAITVASMWIPQSQYWNDYLKDNIRPSDDIVEALRLMRDLRDKVTKLTKQNVNADWEVAVSRVLDQYLALHASLDMKELNDVMSSVNQCQITTKSIVEHIMKSIVAHCPVPSCKNDFVGIARVVHSGGPDFRIDFPSNLYTPEVIRSFIFDIGSQVPSIDLNGDNIFDEIILNLHKSLIDIDASIGSGGLSGLNSDEDYLAVVKSHDIGSMAQKVATLKELYEELVQLIGDVHISIEDSRLGDALSHVAALQPIIEKFTGTLKTGFQSVFVVDTNVLIKEPDLLKAFGHGELIVVAKRVIEELDDLKLKENQRVKASGISQEDSLLPSITRATRFLREFPVNRIQFCDGDMSLLSPDYRNKGDNLILSVAVKFKLYRPELLTNDNLLALKAQAEGISTLTSSEYLQRAQAKAKKSSAQSKSTPRPRAKESRQVEKASPPGRKL